MSKAESWASVMFAIRVYPLTLYRPLELVTSHRSELNRTSLGASCLSPRLHLNLFDLLPKQSSLPVLLFLQSPEANTLEMK